MENTVTCLVRGPGSRYPRGYLWVAPVWFAIITVALLAGGERVSGRVPLWLGLTEIGSLAIGLMIFCAALITARHQAFYADEHGIWLGVPTSRRRPGLRQVHLAWPDVGLVWLEPRRYGALLEISLAPAARVVRRPGPLRSALLLAAILIVPAWIGRGRPALTSPAGHPPRYRLKVCDRDPAELRTALAALRPDTVPVRMPVAKPHAVALPSASRHAGQPPSPVS